MNTDFNDFHSFYNKSERLRSEVSSRNSYPESNEQLNLNMIKDSEHADYRGFYESENAVVKPYYESFDSKLKCFACRNLYHQPRILPCLHTFCSACILNLQTYPCNLINGGSSVSSQENSRNSAYLNSEGSEDKLWHTVQREDTRHETVMNDGRRRRERSSSRTRGVSEERDVHSIPRGKSQQAKLIEKKLKLSRSSSCGESFHDTALSIWPDSGNSSIQTTATTTTSLRRKGSLTSDQIQKAYRRSVGSSVSFRDCNESMITPTAPCDVDFVDSKERIVLCPKCLREVEISATLEELPRNFMLERLVAKHMLIQKGRDVHCESIECLEKSLPKKLKGSHGKTSACDVAAFCVDCQKVLCTSCESSHRYSEKKKWHQIIPLNSHKPTIPADSSSNNSNSTESSEYYSMCDSMSTIAESMREEPETVGTASHTLSKSTSKGLNVIDNVKKLKLPNMHKFGRLFNWKLSSRPTSQHSSTSVVNGANSKDSRGKIIDHNSMQMNGLVNNAFEDRRFRESDNGRDIRKMLSSSVMESSSRDPNGLTLENDDTVTDSLLIHSKREPKQKDKRPRHVDSNHVIPCWKHPDEALEMFCVTCEVCVCRTCVYLQHGGHDCQVLTGRLFQDQMEEVDNLIQEILPQVKDVDSQLTSLIEVKGKISQRSMEVKGNINTFMDTYVEAIERHREQLLEQVTSLASAHECKLNVTRTHLEDMRSDVEQTCRFVSEVLIGSSDLEILSMKKLIKQRLEGFRKDGKRLAYPTDTFIRFCPTVQGQIINNFQMFGKVKDSAPSATRSILLTKGLLDAKVSEQCRAALNVSDADGKAYTGSDVIVRAWIIADGNGGVPVGVQESSSDGMYALTFTPNSRGTHFLHVTVNGGCVLNSPFKFAVKQKRRRHQGAWQCCTLCHSGGRRDVSCGCGYFHAEGGYVGCVHGTPGHPGAYHWSCCGKTAKSSYCDGQTARPSRRQITL